MHHSNRDRSLCYYNIIFYNSIIPIISRVQTTLGGEQITAPSSRNRFEYTAPGFKLPQLSTLKLPSSFVPPAVAPSFLPIASPMEVLPWPKLLSFFSHCVC